MATFTDYVVAPGGGKRISLVKRQYSQLEEEYHPSKDFYGAMLKAIRNDISAGAGTAAMDHAVRMAHSRAVASYTDVRDRVAPWVRKAQKATIILPGRWEWAQPSMTVRVNPDFGLLWPDGRVEVVKVYFKQPQLTPFHAEAMNRLLEYAMPHLPTTGAPVLLEARRGKAWNPPAKRNPTMDSYLKSEALSYGSLWQGLAA